MHAVRTRVFWPRVIVGGTTPDGRFGMNFTPARRPAPLLHERCPLARFFNVPKTLPRVISNESLVYFAVDSENRS